MHKFLTQHFTADVAEQASPILRTLAKYSPYLLEQAIAFDEKSEIEKPEYWKSKEMDLSDVGENLTSSEESDADLMIKTIKKQSGG